MINESGAMRQIHEIRERLFEKRKNMSEKELVRHINSVAERFIKENNLKLKRFEKKVIYRT